MSSRAFVGTEMAKHSPHHLSSERRIMDALERGRSVAKMLLEQMKDRLEAKSKKSTKRRRSK